MKTLSKNIFWLVMTLLLIAFIFSLFYTEQKPPTVFSIDQLVSKINSGEVSKIVVAGNDLKVELKDGSQAISKKETEAGLSETLKNYNVEPTALQKVSLEIKEESGFRYWAGILIPSLLPLLIIGVFLWLMFRQARTGMSQAFTFGKANIKLFTQFKDRITFKDVAGLKEAKEELIEVVDFLKNPKKYLEIGARIPRGVLLLGPPGTGKTLIARAVAGEANVPFFHISGSEFVEMFVGVGASRVRDLFQTAKKAGRCIIFVDEIDAVGRERGAGLGGGHDEREQTLNQILVEMDGFERNDERIVLAASVVGDTPVLIKQNNEIKLLPITEVIDKYYRDGQEGEKLSPDLEVLGFESKNRPRLTKNLYFGSAAFKKVRSVFRHKVDTVYEIEYLGGKIQATGNHSVFVRSKSRGIETKAVVNLKPGDVLIDLPYKVNRTNKNKREIRAFKFEEGFNLGLQVWQPLFAQFESINTVYQYALTYANEISQTRLGKELGFSQRTIGKWQEGICGPRELSRNYYQHQFILPEKIKATPDLMRLFGYYVAEGYARKEIDFCLNITEKEKIADIKMLMKQIFNLEPSREKNITDNAINIVYYCKPLAEFFGYHCGKGAYHKHIPNFLFGAPKEYFVEFLKGYFNGDGYKDKQGRLEITSVNRQLILELNWLARMYGFKSYIHYFRAKEGRVIKNGKPLRATIAWRIGFGKTQNPFKKVNSRESIKRAIIKRVRKIPYSGFVYDFCGCENEAFFGGSSPVLLHNTNRPDVLDPALLRPGRFDRRIILDMPDINDREEILKIHSRGKILARDVNLRRVAERTPGFSGADLANLMNEAALLAAKKNQKEITQQDIFDSVEKVLLGPERRSRVLSAKEKEITAYHEAGHSLVAASLKNADPVHKVSIVARGRTGGYTLKLPIEETYLRTKSQFMTDLAVLLGGYASEQMTFNDISTGASNDLQNASDLARKLVTKFGMSEKLGPVTYGKVEELIFLGREIATEKNYSEKIAGEIDKEVKNFIDKALEVAKKIIISRKKVLKAIAKKLIEKETLEREEFENLIKSFKLKPISI